MSDVSGSGVASEGSSYLTGYPLQDAGMYALARTWSAPEMPRPGCVWTHTLLIEYPDLATISTLSRLDNLFARPDGQAWSRYSAPTVLDMHERELPEPRMSPQDEAWLMTVLNALYQLPQDRVVARRDPAVSVEALMLRIWDQQWPRLRRSFRFCTFTTKDRSSNGGAFDLQVLPGIDSASRVRLPSTHEASSVDDACKPGWLATLMDDARQPDLNGLRYTLKRLGAEILGGREAMPTFCEFHRLTTGAGSPSALREAIGMLEQPNLLASSDFARAQAANHVLCSVEDADPLALAFFWDNCHYIDPARLQQRLSEVASPLWRVSGHRLLTALRNQADAASPWAMHVVKMIPAKDLLNYWPAEEVPLKELLTVRSDLLDIPAFWARVNVRAPNDLQGIELPDSAVVALLRGVEREIAMLAAVQRLGAIRVLDVLQSLSCTQELGANELRWVQYCVKDAWVIADFLNRVQTPSVELLLAFTGLLATDAVPNQYGDDPWLTALRRVKEQARTLPNRLAAYGFARALGWSSRNVAELLQLTFEQLHTAVASSTLDESQWHLIEPKLTWVAEEKRWNRGWRLRSAVVGAFMDRRLWPRAFAWMASNNAVFIALMEEAADRWWGRRFLKSVEESLEHEHDAPTRARRDLIHSFVHSRGRL